jgi:hypothetical protein
MSGDTAFAKHTEPLRTGKEMNREVNYRKEIT